VISIGESFEQFAERVRRHEPIWQVRDAWRLTMRARYAQIKAATGGLPLVRRGEGWELPWVG